MPEKLSDLGEFGFIRRITSGLPPHDAVIEGIGDDCAVVRAGETVLLVTSDAAVEEVHFSLSLAAPEDIGWRAATAAISDIAAMGGKPLCLTLSLALPAHTPVAVAEALFQGVRAATEAHDTAIAGGDTTQSRAHIYLDITVIGTPVSRYVVRRGAQEGDVLAVTGYPGRAAAGLYALQQGIDASQAPWRELIGAHLHPHARIREGQWLAAHAAVHAMMDVSDGLLQDAGHLADASGLGIHLHSGKIPVAAALEQARPQLESSPLELVLAGGEDYELLLALAPAEAETLCRQFEDEFGLPLTLIGECEGAWRGLQLDGTPTAPKGYDHFR
jgi:thiamine-monophosphate kinase